ncbi:MAG: 4-hydroxy-3-methylbut-2-enyl diphosphate reductase [Lachnospiraceae bacterium]|nr:4-hydroxy-3-methylbut-2-enyl diphosphate reductase [Lachnospiraceae bacterium]
MEVIMAKTAGFCFGVKRAVDQVHEQLAQGGPIYTYGPIIHNESVVENLEKQGVRVIETLQELKTLEKGTVIIRSCGVAKEIYESLKESGMKIVDATCPFVKRIHDIVEKESRAGAQIIIIGDDGHPEVEGIKGWCVTPAVVVGKKEDAEAFLSENIVKNPPGNGLKLCIVSQTTYNYTKFQEFVEIFSKIGYDGTVVNTICNATEERQTEAAEIAGMVDAMVVIGGRTSSNSKKLYEICRSKCGNTVFIRTLDDLKLNLKGNARKIGITAGASTPNNIIEEVQNYVRINF